LQRPRDDRFAEIGAERLRDQPDTQTLADEADDRMLQPRLEGEMRDGAAGGAEDADCRAQRWCD